MQMAVCCEERGDEALSLLELYDLQRGSVACVASCYFLVLTCCLPACLPACMSQAGLRVIAGNKPLHI